VQSGPRHVIVYVLSLWRSSRCALCGAWDDERMRFEECEGGWILTARQSVSKDESTREDVVSFMVMDSEVLILREECA
jgi:hypothetical protein